MRARLLICCALLVGCASSGSDPAATRRSEVTRVADAATMALGTTELGDGRDGTIAAPMADVWRVLPAVLDSLGIPVSMVDPATSSMGNAGFEVRRLLGGTMVSRYFDCGEGRGGNSAVSYDLFLALVARVRATSATTTALSTSTTVRARPISTSGAWIRCESRGLLERRIEEAVARRVAR